MKKQLISLTVITIALVLSGCGQKKLSDAEKARVQATLSSVGTLHSSVNKVDRSVNGPSNANRMQDQFISNVFPVDGSNEAQKTAIDNLSAELEKAVQSGDCKIEIKMPDFEQVGSSFDFELSMQVSGDSCPIYMNLSTSMESKAKDQSIDLKGDFKWEYEIKDESFNNLIDINKLNLSGNYNLKATENSGKGGLNIKGSLFSQKEGEIKIDISGKANGSSTSSANAELKFKLSYSDFACELKFKMDDKGNSTYFINGEKVSEQEFQKFVEGIAVNLGGASLEKKSESAEKADEQPHDD